MHLVENLESRVLISGTLARGFGTHGQVTTPAGQNNELIVVQNDGNFIVAGSAGASGSTQGFLERFHGNGHVDDSFGTHGRVDLSTTQFADVLSLAVASGKIVIVGTDGNGNDVLARLTGNGRFDATFGTKGIVSLPAGATAPTAKVEKDQSILYSANYSLTNNTSPVGIFLHYSRKGTRDMHFGVNGLVVNSAGPSFVAGDFYIYPKGQFASFFKGTGTVTNTSGMMQQVPVLALELFDANGVLDLNFYQNNGINIPAQDEVRFVDKGYIVSVGSASSGTTTTTLYFSNGSVDTRWAARGGGHVNLPFPGNTGNSSDFAFVRSPTSFVIAESGSTATGPYVALGGLLKKGGVDHGFGRKGVRQISPGQAVTTGAIDGSHVILLENPGTGRPQQIWAYNI